MINFVLMGIKNSLNLENSQKYEIVHYSEVENYPKITSSKLYSSLEYNNLNNICFTIFDNDEWVSLYVIENNKIVSFFPHIVFGVGPTKPYLLNIKQNGFSAN